MGNRVAVTPAPAHASNLIYELTRSFTYHNLIFPVFIMRFTLAHSIANLHEDVAQPTRKLQSSNRVLHYRAFSDAVDVSAVICGHPCVTLSRRGKLIGRILQCCFGWHQVYRT